MGTQFQAVARLMVTTSRSPDLVHCLLLQGDLGLWADMFVPCIPHLLVLRLVRKTDSRQGSCPGSMPGQELHLFGPVVDPHALVWHALAAVLWQT